VFESSLFFSNDQTELIPPIIEAVVISESRLFRSLLVIVVLEIGSLIQLFVEDKEDVDEGGEVIRVAVFICTSDRLVELEFAGLFWLKSDENVSFWILPWSY